MTMLEKAARAIAQNAADRSIASDNGFFKMKYPGGSEQYLNERWTLYTPDARAVLLAIREPDETMVVAICHEAEKEQARPVAIHRTDAALCWQTGIDAILKEQ